MDKEKKVRSAEEIYFKHTGESWGKSKMSNIKAAMEEYASQLTPLSAPPKTNP